MLYREGESAIGSKSAPMYDTTSVLTAFIIWQSEFHVCGERQCSRAVFQKWSHRTNPVEAEHIGSIGSGNCLVSNFPVTLGNTGAQWRASSLSESASRLKVVCCNSNPVRQAYRALKLARRGDTVKSGGLSF